MELKNLNKNVLKLWYIRAAIISLALIGFFVSAIVILIVSEAPSDVRLAVLLAVGIPDLLFLALTLVMPVLRYKMFSWS